MIKFIDLRDQDIGVRFAFWDTDDEEIMSFYNEETWESWAQFEFESDFCFGHFGVPSSFSPNEAQKRFKKLCPEWVFDKEIEDE